MAKKRKTAFDLSAILNNFDYMLIYNQLMEIAINMIEWVNLPLTCDERYLELALYEQGKAIFFKDDVVGFLSLRFASGGNLDVYGVPTIRRAYSSTNSYTKDLSNEDSIVIYNNRTRTPAQTYIRYQAMRIWAIDRAIDVNANAQKTPVLIQCNENQRLTLQNLYMMFEGNQPFIFGDDSLDMSRFKVLKTDAPYTADKLFQLRTNIWNETLTYLGVSNVNTQKKERLISGEVQLQQGGVNANRCTRLSARQDAAKRINEMFNLNIEVKYREEFIESLKNGEEVEESEVE